MPSSIETSVTSISLYRVKSPRSIWTISNRESRKSTSPLLTGDWCGMATRRGSWEMIIVHSTPGPIKEDMLKQPLQTQVSLSTSELDDFHFEPGSHIHLPLRDFKVFYRLALLKTGCCIACRKSWRTNPCNVLPPRQTMRRFLWPRTTGHNMRIHYCRRRRSGINSS